MLRRVRTDTKARESLILMAGTLCLMSQTTSHHTGRLQSPKEPGLKFALAAVLSAVDYKKCNGFSCHEGDKVLCKFEYSPKAVHVICDFLYPVWQDSVLCRNSSRRASIHSAYYVSSSGLTTLNEKQRKGGDIVIL